MPLAAATAADDDGAGTDDHDFLMSLRFGISVSFLHGEIDGSGIAFSRREYMKKDFVCQEDLGHTIWGTVR